MKGKCPRCTSEELIFLFQQERRSPNGNHVHTWLYLECCDCNLVFIEQHGISSTKEITE